MKVWLYQLLGVLLISMAGPAAAQRPSQAAIAPDQIFCMDYNFVGIPYKHQVYIYGLRHIDAAAVWQVVDSAAIPEGTLAIDGNIRKIAFLTDRAVIFKEQGMDDTLPFGGALTPIAPRLWIRGPNSTETDSYWLSGEKNICYYRDYDDAAKAFKWYTSDKMNPYIFKGNYTEPVLTDKDGFNKLYSFNPGSGEYLAAVFKDHIGFYRYPMVQQFTEGKGSPVDPASLRFALPENALTAFVYDYKSIAVVTAEQIVFYRFDRIKKHWMKDPDMVALKWKDLPGRK